MRLLKLLVTGCFIAGCTPAPSTDMHDAPIDFVVSEANEGNSAAIHNLCYRYKYGKRAKLDYGLARQWCAKGALLGANSSKTLLAEMHYYGEGGPVDFSAARLLYESAASHGHNHARLMLYFLYHKGQGVSVDDSVAMNYLNLAADAGYEKAVIVRNGIPGK